MVENIFEEIQNKKKNFENFIEKALKLGWITSEEANGFKEKIKNDKLTLGVIGQMKCGKSTFLNSLIFKDEILPSATTPMTASLAVITYGEQKRLEVEFYSKEDWEELKYHANRNESEIENDENLASKIKAAKELYQKAQSISNLTTLLGTKKSDDFNQLIEYVGADGKYVAITKSVKIEYPLEYLKGVEIVDTPGFNDPIVSREERTKEFLSKADAVLMLLYAGRPFDSTDKDIIFDKVGNIGVGKVLIGVNKFDICYMNGETENEILTNIKKQLKEASKDYPNSAISELILEHEPLLLSANMALMSQMELSKVRNNENLNFYYQKALSDFEISTQSELYEKSYMKDFESAIKKMVIDSKSEILIQKPLNFIKQKGENKLKELSILKQQLDTNISILSKSDEEFEDLQKNLDRITKRYHKKITGFEIAIIEILLESIKILKIEVYEVIASTREKCIEDINNRFVVFNSEKLFDEMCKVIDRMERKLDRDFLAVNNNLNLSVKKSVNVFVNELEDLTNKYLEDFDFEDFIKVLQQHFSRDIVDLKFTDLIESTNDSSEESLLVKGLLIYSDIVNMASLGMLKKGISALTAKGDTKNFIEEFFSYIDISPIEERIKTGGDILISNLKSQIENEFFRPIQDQIDNVVNNLEEKERILKEKELELEKVNLEKTKFEEEYKEMESLSILFN